MNEKNIAEVLQFKKLWKKQKMKEKKMIKDARGRGASIKILRE